MLGWVIVILWHWTGAPPGRVYFMSLHTGGMPRYEHDARNHNGTIISLLVIIAPAAFADVGIMAKLAEGG